MFYLTPTENNIKAREMFEKNIFSVTRQLRYSQDAGKLALDMCLFINGLPVITFELKNQLTKQNVDDAVQQYKDDRDPREVLFSFKRCMVHFAVDDGRIKFCTKLSGKDSWFLPFDKGYNDGAGNPPNPDGIMTDYLWKDILTKQKLSRIIENYAQVVEEVDPETKKKSVKQIFPRYHQLDVVEKLLADVKGNGVGQKYLIQHSAGSGKSNSIAWLAHQLIGLEKDGRPMIDSVIVVTDRRILDKQIRDTIKQFMQVSNTVVWAEHSGDLTKAITDGKRITEPFSMRESMFRVMRNSLFSFRHLTQLRTISVFGNSSAICDREQRLMRTRPLYCAESARSLCIFLAMTVQLAPSACKTCKAPLPTFPLPRISAWMPGSPAKPPTYFPFPP